MPTPIPHTSSDISVTLRLDVLESASSENGCIDKFAVFVTMTIPAPFNISFFLARAPVAIVPVRPFYTADNDYDATPPDEWPLDALALFHANINESFVQSSRSGYATHNGMADGRVVEFWFHRANGTDISTSEFALDNFPDPPGKFIYHYGQLPGHGFLFRSYYQNGLDAFSQPLYGLAQTDSATLSIVGCSSGGGGDPDPDPDPEDCACEWTDAGLAPDTAWARPTNACAPFTLEPLPATTWTKRGCP